MSKVNKELLKICDWFQANRLSLNVKNIILLFLLKKHQDLNIFYSDLDTWEHNYV